MNKDIQTQWVAALRSGKYKQTQEMLCQTDGDGNPAGYCCLGVLCDLAVTDGVIPPPRASWLEPGAMRFYSTPAFLESDATDTVLPNAVRAWAGLASVDPRLPPMAADLLPLGSSEEFHLSSLNDEGADFGVIADLIEEFGEEL